MSTRADITLDEALRRLNEGGDGTLRQRRKVIKRVSEFEDFSSCYDNDRLQAQGLVAQVCQLVNVKDSFTRMNIEREKERRARQESHKAAVEAARKRAAEMAELRGALYKLFAQTDPIKPHSMLNR